VNGIERSENGFFNGWIGAGLICPAGDGERRCPIGIERERTQITVADGFDPKFSGDNVNIDNRWNHDIESNRTRRTGDLDHVETSMNDDGSDGRIVVGNTVFGGRAVSGAGGQRQHRRQGCRRQEKTTRQSTNTYKGDKVELKHQGSMVYSSSPDAGVQGVMALTLRMNSTELENPSMMSPRGVPRLARSTQ